MLLLATLQLVPASLLLFIATVPIPAQGVEVPWLFDPRSSLRSLPTIGFLSRRRETFTPSIVSQTPVAVRKMSDDGGEMFFPEYWQFEANSVDNLEVNLDKRKPTLRSPEHLDEGDASRDWSNSSIPQILQAPFSLHTDQQLDSQPLLGRLLRTPRAIFSLDQRAFQCPGGTTACTSINRPNSCCSTGETCQLITDTGSGDVGCCGNGQTCGEEVASCQPGYPSCPDSAGGGCCVPGYACVGVGCTINGTATTTVEATVTVSAPTSTKLASSSKTTSTNTIPAPLPLPPASASTNPTTTTSTFIATTSVISTATAPRSSTKPTSTKLTSTDPPTSTATSSPSSITSTTSTTSTSTRPAASTSSAAANLPVRPTSNTLPTTTTTAQPTTITATQCPTGYYQCDAYYQAGCCQVGRNCGLTSCPLASSTQALNSLGVTVAVPTNTDGANVGLGASGCAAGWFSCAAGQGGGCCPSGYACGTSCTATGVVVGTAGVTGTGKVAKDNGAERIGGKGAGLWVVVSGVGLGVLLL